MAFKKYQKVEKVEALKKDELENASGVKPKLATLQPSKV